MYIHNNVCRINTVRVRFYKSFCFRTKIHDDKWYGTPFQGNTFRRVQYFTIVNAYVILSRMRILKVLDEKWQFDKENHVISIGVC